MESLSSRAIILLGVDLGVRRVCGVWSVDVDTALTFKTRKGGVFSEPAFFLGTFQARPTQLTHVRASPGDCAAGWAQAWREI